jgi:hypothetical protein
MTASSMCLAAFSSGTSHWTSSQETCVRLTLTSHTRLTASEPQALHNAGRLAWGSGPRGEKPDYTGLDVIIVRGDKMPRSMCSSIQCHHDTTECSRWARESGKISENCCVTPALLRSTATCPG